MGALSCVGDTDLTSFESDRDNSLNSIRLMFKSSN